MSISIEKISNLGHRLTGSLENKKLKQAFASKMQNLQQNAALKGFRKGKVPAKFLLEKYGSALKSEVLESAIKESLISGLQESKLVVAGLPTIESVTNLDLTSDQDVHYVAQFEIYPDIVFADLSDVVLEKTVVDIQEDDVTKMIESLKSRFCEWEAVSRNSALSDRLTVDLTIRSIAEDKPITVKKSVKIWLDPTIVFPELVENLVDHSINESITFDLKYPDEWVDAEYAGQMVTMKAVIHTIEAQKKLTEEALMKALAVTDEGQLKQHVREMMEKQVKHHLHEIDKEKVLEILIEKNPIDLPQSLIHQERQALIVELKNNQHPGVALDRLSDEEIDDMAQKRVLLGLLVKEQVKKRGLVVSQAQLVLEARKFSAEQSNNYSQAFVQTLERTLLLDQVVLSLLEEMKSETLNKTFYEVIK